MKRVTLGFTSAEKGNEHDLLSPLLNSVYSEIKELSKKKQDDPLNKLKVQMINRILERVKELLAEEPTAQFLDLLDDETLPTNSDAVMMLAQFQTAMAEFKTKYHHWDSASGESRWFTKAKS